MAPSLNLKTLTPNLQPIKTQHLIDEIFMHYKKQEVNLVGIKLYFTTIHVKTTSCISQPYMSKQHDITDRMRGILIDWLDEVHYEFELERQTGEGNGEYPSVNSFCSYPICFYQEVHYTMFFSSTLFNLLAELSLGQSSERASETNSHDCNYMQKCFSSVKLFFCFPFFY
ncbi:hypothetical protein LXL04_015255 [Taraxacum kok-saghyz]